MRVPCLVVALAVGLAAGCARRAAPVPPAPSPAPPPVRAPAPSGWSAAQLRRLQSRLRGALGASALATSGIAILDVGGKPLFLRRERVPVAPASTFKLIVATTALEMLGPAYRFQTSFDALEAPRRGVLDGSVYLLGEGDPTLTSGDLRRGAAQVARAGVARIAGDVVADGSAFGGPEVNPAWEPDDLQYDYAAGASALSLDEGTVEFDLVPRSLGAAARIEVRPAGAVRTRGTVVTGETTDLWIDRAAASNEFAFAGRISAGAEQSFFRPVIHQPAYAAAVARAMLERENVAVAGRARVGLAPLSGDVLWLHRSAPLGTILRDMLFVSDNHDAEQLLRAVAAHAGAIGTVAAGAALERAVLARLKVPTGGLRIVDGSGLAPSDRVTPLTLATLLSREAREPSGEVLYRDLPAVGREGTVRYRNVTTALGRSRAKSGHIENVNSLAGYVDTRDHGRVAFAIVVNDPRADDGPVDTGIDEALDILAGS